MDLAFAMSNLKKEFVKEYQGAQAAQTTVRREALNFDEGYAFRACT